MKKITFYYYTYKDEEYILATREYPDTITYKDMISSIKCVCTCFKSVINREIMYKEDCMEGEMQ